MSKSQGCTSTPAQDPQHHRVLWNNFSIPSEKCSMTISLWIRQTGGSYNSGRSSMYRQQKKGELEWSAPHYHGEAYYANLMLKRRQELSTHWLSRAETICRRQTRDHVYLASLYFIRKNVRCKTRSITWGRRNAATCFIEHEDSISNEDRSSLNRSFEMYYLNIRRHENKGADIESNQCAPAA